MKRTLLVQLIGFLFFVFSIVESQPPRLVIGFVVDQLSYDNFMKIAPNFGGGFKKLIDNGIIYHKACWPHGMPGTAPGHTGLVTGTIPSVHGITNNDWPDEDGNKITADADTPENAAVFSPTGYYPFGKSTRNTMVDTICDQIKIASGPNRSFAVYSITGKSRSATAMAGKMGKAIWFDDNAGQYTSSKAYFDELPNWLTTYNADNKKKLTSYAWKPFFPSPNKAYSCANPNSYNYTKTDSVLDVMQTLDETEPKTFYNLIEKMPLSHELVLGCALNCLEHLLKEETATTIVLWIGFSAVDKVGHLFGNTSKEYIDILYHLDAQLDRFMREVGTKVNPADTLFLLTADHGSMPIVELLNEKKFSLAKRINTIELANELNAMLEKKIGIKNLINQIDTPNIYFNQSVWKVLDEKKQKTAENLLKKTLKKKSGIKQVWTYKDLEKANFGPHDICQFYKNQIFPGRSGQLIFQVYPYVFVSKYPTGAGHKTPYEYDVHVPLIFYQPTVLSDKQIQKSVFVQQVAPTLASILDVPCPSACSFDVLPGILP
ncbi:alkaline phosphatase family protein [Candidatus Dependentiae bacterium]|nr:alkaline phosphatase family protein [Candidatus Dependentiae bacterium]